MNQILDIYMNALDVFTYHPNTAIAVVGTIFVVAVFVLSLLAAGVAVLGVFYVVGNAVASVVRRLTTDPYAAQVAHWKHEETIRAWNGDVSRLPKVRRCTVEQMNVAAWPDPIGQAKANQGRTAI
jgi:hypothetical protein